ncbi:hypothetical protein EHJ37_19795 [Vibrio parahaemolyticus]|nr:hypothetical protein [Vibrio parahaemolyticus]
MKLSKEKLERFPEVLRRPDSLKEIFSKPHKVEALKTDLGYSQEEVDMLKQHLKSHLVDEIKQKQEKTEKMTSQITELFSSKQGEMALKIVDQIAMNNVEIDAVKKEAEKLGIKLEQNELEQRPKVEKMGNEFTNWFVEAVAKARGMDRSQLEAEMTKQPINEVEKPKHVHKTGFKM